MHRIHDHFSYLDSSYQAYLSVAEPQAIAVR